MSSPTFERVADAVWRLGPDRVIARHASIDADDASVDLTGLAALVWVALDESGSVAEIDDRLSVDGLGAPLDDVQTVVDQLVDAGWLRRRDGRGMIG